MAISSVDYKLYFLFKKKKDYKLAADVYCKANKFNKDNISHPHMPISKALK